MSFGTLFLIFPITHFLSLTLSLTLTPSLSSLSLSHSLSHCIRQAHIFWEWSAPVKHTVLWVFGMLLLVVFLLGVCKGQDRREPLRIPGECVNVWFSVWFGVWFRWSMEQITFEMPAPCSRSLVSRTRVERHPNTFATSAWVATLILITEHE